MISKSPLIRGSIPACTGKPHEPQLAERSERVYPRMYGETTDPQDCAGAPEGLSPHVRGNPVRSAPFRALSRSIPACTGKPCLDHSVLKAYVVYPRMYGETTWQDDVTGEGQGLSPHVRGNPKESTCEYTGRKGLSPHVRGNRADAEASRTGVRSIPACTGKPGTRQGGSAPIGVYPRMYGETASIP